MTTQKINKETIGQIVADDFRAAAIFKKAGIDFCCGGTQTLEKACKDKRINVDELRTELDALKSSLPSESQDFKHWNLGFLADYIVNTHHQYVLRTLPDLVGYTEKIAVVHGLTHPELNEVMNLFAQINKELQQHLKNEEEVLFPAIKEVMKSGSAEAKATIVSEISRMNDEHEFAGGAMDRINYITHGYQLPEDACNTYKVAFKLLEQFEDDLHVHVHLENNILFPKALALTKG